MQGRLQDAAESYVNWWALSGVDMTFAPEPIAYSTENVATLARQGDKISAPDSVTEQTISREVPGNPASAPTPEAQPLALPDSLPEMLRYLAEQELFTGPLAAPHKILPAGEAGAKCWRPFILCQYRRQSGRRHEDRAHLSQVTAPATAKETRP